MKKAIIAVSVLCFITIAACTKQPGAKRCFTCTITQTVDTVTTVKHATYCDATQEDINNEVEYQKRVYGIIYSCK